MSITGVHGHLLEVTVVGCNMKDPEGPHLNSYHNVFFEYGGGIHVTTACAVGGANPSFPNKSHFILKEGHVELNVAVWKHNTPAHPDVISFGKVPLHKVLSDGYDVFYCPLQKGNERNISGEVRLTLYRYPITNNPATASGNFPLSLPLAGCQYYSPSPTPHIPYPPRPASPTLFYPPYSMANPSHPPAYSFYHQRPLPYPPPRPAGVPSYTHQAYPFLQNLSGLASVGRLVCAILQLSGVGQDN